MQDRRLRLLYLTEQGTDLERRLTAVQKQRFAAAFSAAGADAVEGFRKVLLGIIADEDRERFDDERLGLSDKSAAKVS